MLTLAAVLYASWLAYGGRGFAATLTAFAFFFLVMLLLAARGVSDRLLARFGAGSGYILCVAVFLVYLIYPPGDKYFRVHSGRSNCRTDSLSARSGRVGGEAPPSA